MNIATTSIVKEAYIRQLSDGRYRVYSEKGKNLGTSKQKGTSGKAWAKKRLQQVEMFKHMKKRKKKSSVELYFEQAFDDINKVSNPPHQSCLVKFAAGIIQMGDAQRAGKTLADVAKFLLQRISEEKRPKSSASLRDKIWHLNEHAISSKETPASASLGQAITFIKTVLNGHPPDYIREILRNIVINM